MPFPKFYAKWLSIVDLAETLESFAVAVTARYRDFTVAFADTSSLEEASGK